MSKEHSRRKIHQDAPQPGKAPDNDQLARAKERAEGEGMVGQAPAAPQGKASRQASPTSGVEGEGSYSASRRYDEGVARSVAKGQTEKLADEAAKALDGPEGADLRKAEKAGKHGHA